MLRFVRFVAAAEQSQPRKTMFTPICEASLPRKEVYSLFSGSPVPPVSFGIHLSGSKVVKGFQLFQTL